MKLNRLLMMLAMSILTLSVSAQGVSDKMKEAQMRGFGAQNTQANTKSDSTAKTEGQAKTDTDPEFPGGEVFLQAYLKKKLTHAGVSGKGEVVVSFKVDKKGNIYGAEVTKSAGNALDTAAFNIVTGMPRWRPGLTKGEPADKPASVTINFGQ